jgi:hypothetical protein
MTKKLTKQQRELVRIYMLALLNELKKKTN